MSHRFTGRASERASKEFTHDKRGYPKDSAVPGEPVIAFVSEMREWEEKLGANTLCAIIDAIYDSDITTAQ